MKFSIPEYLKEEEEKEVNRKFKHLMQKCPQVGRNQVSLTVGGVAKKKILRMARIR